jgi:RNA polymerase sigma factor (sigma-70 family)
MHDASVTSTIFQVKPELSPPPRSVTNSSVFGNREAMGRATDDEPGRLLARTAGGDAEAFGLFYDLFEDDLLRFFLRRTGRGDLAADLTAEAFAAALDSAGSYRPELGAPRQWLSGIARHVLHDSFERGRVDDEARRRLGLQAVVLTDTIVDDIERLLDEHGDAAQALEDLPADQREAVRGRVLEDRSYQELAVSLQCSESVVRQRVSRGLRGLRDRLERSS